MITPEYIDIHSHLNFSQFNEDREEVIARMKSARVWTITVGTDAATSKEAIELAESHDGIFATVGLHPDDDKNGTFDEKVFEELVRHPKVVAVGECGLDYSRLGENPEAEKARQKKEFEKQIKFAVTHDLPLMIHCRDAYPDALEMLRSKKVEYGDKLRGNFHFFTSPIETAKECLDLGFFVSFTGPITFVNRYEEIVKFVPLERMMAETDAPLAAPARGRGRRNEPVFVRNIIQKIAEIKGIHESDVRTKLTQNALHLFFKKISLPL